MSTVSTPVTVTEDERAELERWLRSPTCEQRLVFRARVVLAAAAGEGSVSIARREKVRVNTVSTGRIRFAHGGIGALQDQQRAGRPRAYGAEVEQRLLAKLDEPPPEGYSIWNGALLGQALE